MATMGKIVLQPPSILDKRHALLVMGQDDAALRGHGHAHAHAHGYGHGHGHNRKASFGEVAGGTTADCAAVCCCCPCVLVNLVVLAVYKVPKGVCRKALGSKRRRRLMRKVGWPERQLSFSDDSELQIYHISSSTSAVSSAMESDKDVVELEKEMWDKFYGAGFWRSYSQRSEITELSR